MLIFFHAFIHTNYTYNSNLAYVSTVPQLSAGVIKHSDVNFPLVNLESAEARVLFASSPDRTGAPVSSDVLSKSTQIDSAYVCKYLTLCVCSMFKINSIRKSG